MSYTTLVITAAGSEPVTTAELKAHLRLSTTAEDSLLAGYITTARQLFETISGRTLIATTFRQWGYTLTEPVVLQRGAVSSITSVKYYDTAGTLQTDTTYLSDIISTPALVWWQGYPAVSTTKSPVAYVEYVAGYANAAAVPQAIKTAVTLLAAHYFENREAYTPDTLHDLPMGFRQVAAAYALGINGAWGVA